MEHTKLVALWPPLNSEMQTMAVADLWRPKNQPDMAPQLMFDQLSKLMPSIRGQPKGMRVLYLNHLLEYDTNAAGPSAVDFLPILRQGYIDTTVTERALLPLSKRLKNAKVPIDMIFCDVETGCTVWAVGFEQVQKWLSDPAVRAKLPSPLNTVPMHRFEYGAPGYRRAVNLWGDYANGLLINAIKRITLRSGLFNIVDPATGKPRQPRVVNYWFGKRRFPIYDYNGWVFPDFGVDGRSSCRPVYMQTATSARYKNLVHHFTWNVFIDNLNYIRTGIANSPQWRMYPILGYPNECNAWLWEQQLAHAARSGVNWTGGQQFLMYFKSFTSKAEDDLAVEIANRHDQPWPVIDGLPEIPLDSDSVQTGDYVTTYADYLEHATFSEAAAGAP